MEPHKVVLIGGGHAHLHLVTRARHYRRAGARLLLIDPGAFWYSGMATGLISGRYEPDADRIDLQSLANRYGVQFCQSRAIAVDRKRQQVHLENGETVCYDLLSLNLGSRCGPLPYPLTLNDIPVKPIKGLLRLRARVLAEQPERVAIIGGGATGCEIACNLVELASKRGQETAVHLFMREALPADGLPKAARRALADYLQDIGVVVHAGSAVDRCEDSCLFAADRSLGQFGLRAIATGLQASQLDMDPPLTTSQERGFRISDALQTTDPRIYAVGDCADFSERPLPRIGVFGVRQAPILHRNLLASLGRGTATCYLPQTRYLSILNLGFGRGLAVRGRFWWLGPAALQWKEWLDRRFVQGYQQRYRT